MQIKAAGLCHSDLSVIDGSRPRPTPMALGHEAAGIVEAVGEGVSDLKPGDHVVLVFVPSCGRCAPCAAGRPALCEPAAKANAAGTLLSGERRLSFEAEPINHLLGVSAFATHAVAARESCVKIDPDLPLELAALFGCAVLTGVGAVVNTAKVEPGQSVAVVGLGGVGLSVVLGARLAGARQIVAVDLSDDRLAFATKLGATQTVNARSNDAVGEIRRMSGNGVDVAFEMAGSVPALELAYAATARGGMTVTAGLPHPDKRMTSFAARAGRRGAHPERLLCRLVCSAARRAAHDRPLPRRPPAGRPIADPSPEARRNQRRLRPAARGGWGEAGHRVRIGRPQSLIGSTVFDLSLRCVGTRQ